MAGIATWLVLSVSAREKMPARNLVAGGRILDEFQLVVGHDINLPSVHTPCQHTGGVMARRRGRVNIAKQGQRYWSDKGTSRGKKAGIGWKPRSGSYTRCVKRVRPHLGAGANGYCAKRMHDAIGIWPGSRANTGGRRRTTRRR